MNSYLSNPHYGQLVKLFPAPISKHHISTKLSATTYPPLPFMFQWNLYSEYGVLPVNCDCVLCARAAGHANTVAV